MNRSVVRTGASLDRARSAVIFIHGRGSSGEDAIGLAEAIPEKRTAWLAPSAPHRAWYPQRFLVPTEENEPHLSEALRIVDQLFDELQTTGFPADRIGLTGFSQGACLALEYAARNPRRYGFVAALSGALIGPLDTSRPAFDLAQTPVLLACADEDAHIPAEYVEKSEEILSKANASVTRQRFPGNTHAIFPEEIEWIGKILESLNSKTVDK